MNIFSIPSVSNKGVKSAYLFQEIVRHTETIISVARIIQDTQFQLLVILSRNALPL
jgi:hypothetical protein